MARLWCGTAKVRVVRGAVFGPAAEEPAANQKRKAQKDFREVLRMILELEEGKGRKWKCAKGRVSGKECKKAQGEI